MIDFQLVPVSVSLSDRIKVTFVAFSLTYFEGNFYGVLILRDGNFRFAGNPRNFIKTFLGSVLSVFGN